MHHEGSKHAAAKEDTRRRCRYLHWTSGERGRHTVNPLLFRALGLTGSNPAFPRRRKAFADQIGDVGTVLYFHVADPSDWLRIDTVS